MHISELFMAESKTQVYGHLHDLLQTESDITNDLSKCIGIVYILTRAFISHFCFRIYML